MTIGDVKPLSLRELESDIWKYLYLVSRGEMQAERMVEIVLDSMVEPPVLNSFRFDKEALFKHFREKFDPIRDHTGFFFAGRFPL